MSQEIGGWVTEVKNSNNFTKSLAEWQRLKIDSAPPGALSKEECLILFSFEPHCKKI